MNSKILKLVASFLVLPTSLCFAQSSPSKPSVVVGCLLEQLIAVSPFQERLNFTQGTGKGFDVVISKGSHQLARVGNLHFDLSNGSTLKQETTDQGAQVYTVIAPEMNEGFELTIFPAIGSGGHYGQAPADQSTGILKYVHIDGQKQTLANLICSP